MARRQVEEINAGSMADIAFLILIYFLMTTTMDTDEGIPQMLPQKVPPEVADLFKVEMKERNVFEILVNADDQLLVENEWVQIEELKDMTKEFLANPEEKSNLPEMVLVTEKIAQYKIDSLSSQLINVKKADSVSKAIAFIEADIEDWKNKMEAVKLAGPYKTLPKLSIISLRNDNGTSYKVYISVLDQLQSAMNELRDEWSQRIYKENYTDWNPSIEADQPKLKVIRAIIPSRIAEQEPNNIPTY